MRATLFFLLMAPVLSGAPAPVAGPVKRAPVPAPITAADLWKVNHLTWGEQEYPIAFERSGNYYCTDLTDGRGRVWSGPWHLTGGVIVIDESSAWVAPDAPPTLPGGPHEIRLEIRRDAAGRIVGRGWGNTIRLESR